MWPNPLFSADLVTSTEEILNENFIFLWSACFLISAVFAPVVFWTIGGSFLRINSKHGSNIFTMVFLASFCLAGDMFIVNI